VDAPEPDFQEMGDVAASADGVQLHGKVVRGTRNGLKERPCLVRRRTLRTL